MVHVCSFVILALSLVHSAHSSVNCLDYLNSDGCAKIQTVGQVLAKEVKKADRIFRGVIFRSAKEIDEIVNSTISYWKKEATKVVTKPVITPIEIISWDQIESAFTKIVKKNLESANVEYWKIVQSVGSYRSGASLFSYSTKVKRSAVSGLTRPLYSKLKDILVNIEKTVKTVINFNFQLFTGSLKKLLKGVPTIDLDGSTRNLENLLFSTMNTTTTSLVDTCFQIFQQTVEQLKLIEELVKDVKDTKKLSIVLNPAREFILEAMENILKDNHDELQKRIKITAMNMRNRFIDLKTTLTS